jgi:hypothetical protein
LRIETNDLSDSDNRGIAFTNSGNEVADMRSYFAPAQSYYQLRSSSPAGMSANLNLFALSPSDRSASVTMSAIRSGGSSASVSVLDATISANSEVTLYTSGTIELNATLIAANADIDMNGNDIIDIGTLGETWTSLSFNTGWGNYGGGFHAMKYKKAGDLVFLRGLVVRTSGSSATIATLPSGYRPPSELMLATSSAGAFGIVQITTAGVINVTVGTPTGWVSLDNIVFSTLA